MKTRRTIEWMYVEHERGLSFLKIIGNPEMGSGPKQRGYLAWLRRGDRRQVTIFPNGKIWCEEENSRMRPRLTRVNCGNV